MARCSAVGVDQAVAKVKVFEGFAAGHSLRGMVVEHHSAAVAGREEVAGSSVRRYNNSVLPF